MSTNAAGATGQGSAAALGSAAGKAEALWRGALAAHQEGRLTAARELCEQALRLEPRHFDALHLKGVIAGQSRDPERAADLIARALLINPQSAAAHNNHGNALRALGRLDAAIQSYDQAIALKPDFTEAHYNRANTLRALQRYEEAIAGYTQAIALQPELAEAYYNRGLALAQLERSEAAISSFEQAIARAPSHAQAHYHRGTVLYGLKRYEAALLNFERVIALKPDHALAHNNRALALCELERLEAAVASFDRAIALAPGFAEAHYSRANILCRLNQYEAALSGYSQAIALKPDYPEAYNNRGFVLFDLKQTEAALANFEQAIALKPDHAVAYNNRGLALANLQQSAAAVTSFDKAIALRPDYAEAYNNRALALAAIDQPDAAMASLANAIALKSDYADAHYNRGNLLGKLNQYEAALASFDQTLALDPASQYVLGMRLDAKLQICAWDNIDAELEQLTARIEGDEPVSLPRSVFALTGSPALQRRVAEVWVREECPGMAVAPILKRGGAQKIRIGYFSPDFRLHPVSILMAELFEVHDRERFEVYAFSYGSDTQDEMRVRLEGAFDRFLDVRPLTDPQIVALSRELQIDIAVDLAGFTLEGRPKVFAQRAAPVQVSYLGYAGTMGAPYMDYLIADRVLIPAGAQAHYREKILYMPESFMVNDSKRAIAEKRFSRAELMLPESGFVYCCFNNSYKIAPDTFSGWMRILRAVPDSVLWLPQSNATAQRNLRSEAGSRGVSAERLIFAPRLASMAEHLARLRVADLFLDTLPYNAHTTASDALWAGLPVLTCLGEAFAGRVAGSLLQALGLPELITQSPGEYEALAVQLGLNPERLAGIKGKLAANRLTQPLFDTPRFARHLEAAFAQIHARYQADLPPEHIYVEALHERRANPC